MKNLTNILLLSLVVLTTTIGCSDLKFGDNFLEKAPGVDMTIDSIFSRKLYADRALTGAYATMRSCLTLGNNEKFPNESNGNFGYKPAADKLGWDNLDALTDIINSHMSYGGAASKYYSGTYDAETENSSSGTKMGFNPWQDATWWGIRRAQLYIENVDRVPDMTSKEKERGKGEAYMIMACHYLDLFRNFGGIPLLKNAVNISNLDNADFKRQSVEETLGYIVWLCGEAAKKLPWNVSAAEDGRFTKAAAMGLKIRALAFAASPLFNASAPYAPAQSPMGANASKVTAQEAERMIWLGGYSADRWQQVITACKEFFEENSRNGNFYALVDTDNPAEDFSKCYADRYNGEILISTGRQVETFYELYHTYCFGPSVDPVSGNKNWGWGGGCVTLNYVDLFPTKTGEPARYRNWIAQNGHKGSENNTPFVDRDPRLSESVMVIGGKPFRGRQPEMWIGGTERGEKNAGKAITGFCIRKFFWDFNPETYHYKPVCSPYLRLAELCLTYAEALNETGQTDEAKIWLNKTRNRAGLPDITDAQLARLHPDEELAKAPDYLEMAGDKRLREEIIDERAREFCFEEVRWYDLIRWKRADIFAQPLYGITITGNARDLEFSDPEPEPDRAWTNNFDPKWYLSAFPSDEINKGYGLIQNPGW